MDGIVDKIGATGLLVLLAALCVVLFVYGIAQTFWGYKRRVFFRILPGLWSGLLISAATGFLILMDGARGDVIRLLMDATHGDMLKVVAELIKAAVTNSKAFGQGLDIASGILNAVGATGIMDVVDTVRTMVIVGVLFSVICAVVSAAREKIGVALELFAYGYTPVALYFAMEESTLLGAVLAIVVGALLGALGYRISRMWIIITTGLIGGLIALYSFVYLLSLANRIARNALPGALGQYYMWIFIGNLLVRLMGGAVWAIAVGSLQRALGHQIPRTRIIITIGLYLILPVISNVMRASSVSTFLGILPIIALIICGIYAQLKTTAISTEKTAAQPAAVPADPVLRVLGHQISRMRITIVAGICGVLTCVPISLSEGISTEMALYIVGIETVLRMILQMVFLTVVSIYAQQKALAAPAGKTAAQPAAPATLKSRWAAKLRPAPRQSTEFVSEEPSVQPGANPLLGRTPPAGGQKFCSKCGKPLDPNAKFCGKCGQPIRSEKDTAKPV